ncbi:MAG: NUDIX hydrolase [Acidobacteriota bacterium]|nr:NUDIX hydrolase [Blastocatellia bacterium]MDW8240065.1 NUDIX hydrolase [Acidobacteriota bacterium]
MPAPHTFLVTTDVVLFTLVDGQLNVLLIQRRFPPFQHHWAFPGGFVEPGEHLDDAARRELREETGLIVDTLDQLGAYGDPGRDPRGQVISIVYWAVVDQQNFRPQAEDDAAAVGWFPADDPPPLAFDHAKILRHAIQRYQETTHLKSCLSCADLTSPRV